MLRVINAEPLDESHLRGERQTHSRAKSGSQQAAA